MDFSFIKPNTAGASCQAHFCTWEGLSNLCSALLTGFFERPAFVQAVGESRSDGWSLKLVETPLSQEDLAALLEALQADDYDWDANDFGEYPVWELSQSLGLKLVSRALPFTVEASHASDDGVWFTGGAAAYVVTILRQRFEGRNMELYRSSYRIDRDRLPNPSESACETYLRKIVCDFLRTEDGKRAYESTCRDFNWGDVETEIPSDFFSAYGVVHCGGGPDDGKFLCCGVFTVLVNQDELLGCDVCDDGEIEP